MKRTLTFGGVTAGLLTSAVVAGPADASGSVPSVLLADTPLAAKQIAAFWYGENKANLIGATPYNVETKVAAEHMSTGGRGPYSKPGVIPAVGDERKPAAKSKNVNLPKTTGKVFFIGADHKPHWCSATSVQSRYRNLVATAGHCVYDAESNAATLDKWVFISGYYQGKTPWGIYVGKQAFTHYDYDVYEDGDRDYAFVTVYNGVLPTSLTADGYSKVFETQQEAKDAAAAIENNKNTAGSKLAISPVLDTDHVKPLNVPESQKTYVTADAFHQLNIGKNIFSDGPWMPGTGADDAETTKEAYDSVQKPGSNRLTDDHKTGYWRSEFIPNVGYKYYKRTWWVNYDLDYKLSGKTMSIKLKNVGRLGDNVGGQGLAYNQKVDTPVFVFGYPSGSHLDGNHAYTGKTLKWSYGRTFAAQAPEVKGEELVGVKSSFTGEGSIGSSWLLNYKSGRRLGYLNGVTIGIADTDKNGRVDTSLSPYFDGELYSVYKAAANLWSGKIV
ncbi:serine protease [Microbispora sp. KK1-11]|uniref:trypsin-like serine peptidase n=1 Tax=Microbispora sp. KK1-11 TaxID=2053005 RepID=UPI0021AE5A9F|nr:hypothetical protein [Microbispora sp. KK1-11]